jgi:hypothetical protein
VGTAGSSDLRGGGARRRRRVVQIDQAAAEAIEDAVRPHAETLEPLHQPQDDLLEGVHVHVGLGLEHELHRLAHAGERGGQRRLVHGALGHELAQGVELGRQAVTRHARPHDAAVVELELQAVEHAQVHAGVRLVVRQLGRQAGQAVEIREGQGFWAKGEDEGAHGRTMPRNRRQSGSFARRGG